MEKQIGKNVSSGAKKVERVEKVTQESVDSNVPVQETAKTKKRATVSKTSPKKTAQKRAVKKEEKAAEGRVAEAKKRAEKKQEKAEKKAGLKRAKLEKKAALKEKKLEKKRALAEKKLQKKEMLAKKKAERIEKRQSRKAQLKERRIERKAEKAARRELLKNETKAERQKRIEREKRERIALKAKKQEARIKAREDKLKAREAARSRKADDKKHRREQKTERRRTPGFGGWLAAVISLGTACLVLATVITAGAFRMNDMAAEAESGYRSTLYEMVSTCEDLDDSLGKLRLSGGANEQRKLLTEILVDTALLEASVEKLPVDQATGTDISSFINRTGSFARTMLAKVAAGGQLTEEERARVKSLYEINDGLYQELNTLITEMSANELRDFFAGGGSMAESFTKLAKSTRPAEIADAPFAKEGNIGENRIATLEEISSSEAEARAEEYFAAYHVSDIRYTGETVTPDFSCYDFMLTDENGGEIFAQITKKGGELIFFDTYEECSDKNFDLDECDALAREFLSGLGIGNVEAVWLSDAGMVANLTYTTVEDGVRIYPEVLRVRVCEEKGRVVGLDARGYLLNSKDHNTAHRLSRQGAEGKLGDGLKVYSANLALIPSDGNEVVAYEFGCTYGEEEYIVYVDANTGEEVEIFRVMESAKGSYLR